MRIRVLFAILFIIGVSLAQETQIDIPFPGNSYSIILNKDWYILGEAVNITSSETVTYVLDTETGAWIINGSFGFIGSVAVSGPNTTFTLPLKNSAFDLCLSIDPTHRRCTRQYKGGFVPSVAGTYTVSNGMTSKTFIVLEKASADVSIERVDYTIRKVEDSYVVNFTVAITNKGSMSSDYIFSYEFGDGIGGGRTVNMTLMPGEIDIEKISHLYYPGEYTTKFFATTSDDYDPANNEFEKTVVAKLRDLAVTGVRVVGVVNRTNGSSVQMEVVVKNIGHAKSGSYSLWKRFGDEGVIIIPMFSFLPSPTEASLEPGETKGFFFIHDYKFGDYKPEFGIIVPISVCVFPLDDVSECTVNDGDTSNNIKSIRMVVSNAATSDLLHFGTAVVTDKWTSVKFARNFSDPVIIAGPVGMNGSQPAHARIRNVTHGEFEIKVEEWDYLDGVHIAERVHYIAMERGVHTIVTGVAIEAGALLTGNRFNDTLFSRSFGSTPVVFTQMQTFHGSNAAVTRNDGVTKTGFRSMVQEEEGSKDGGFHAVEKMGYIAAEPGVYIIGREILEAGAADVSSKWTNVQFSSAFGFPHILASVQTFRGSDTAGVRYKNISRNDVELRIEEEQSKDTETGHILESLGFLVFGW